MNSLIESIQAYFTSYKPWISILIVVLTVLLYTRIHIFVKERVKNSATMATKLGHIELAFNINKYILAIIVLIIVLSINGVNIHALTAGIGFSSIVIGFALQDILKDWIMGISIIWDGYFAVGDVVQYKDVVGKVVEFNLKATKIREIVHGNLVTISNRNISEISIMSDWIDFDIPTSYETTFDQMRPVIEDIIFEVKKIKHVRNCEFLDISEFAASSINYRMRAHCNPEFHYIARRKCLSVVQRMYAKHGIKIPFNQLDVHVD